MSDKEQETGVTEAPEQESPPTAETEDGAPATEAPAEEQAAEPEAPAPEPQQAPADQPSVPEEPQGPKLAERIPIEHLPAGRMMQLDACTRCGECLNWCPVYDQDPREEILPRKKAADFLAIVKAQHSIAAKLAGGPEGRSWLRGVLGKVLGHKDLTEEAVEEFAANLYECSTCGQCQIVCPANLDTVNLWEEIRRVMVMAGYGPLEQQKALVKSVKSYDNPWQQPRTARTKWARRAAKKDKTIAAVPKDIQKKGGNILLYLGCTASYDTNVKQVAINTVNILDALGIDYGILGNKEACCGSVMLRMGDPEYERVFAHNIELFNSLGIEALVTSCAGCYKTINEDYQKVGELNFEVIHTAQFLRRMLDSGELEFVNQVNRKVTYHDPCHLGRASGVYDDPRIIMNAIPGLELVEMERTREYSRCCGAGGGLKSGYPDVQNKMSQERIREAMATGAEQLVSCCPFCFQGLQVGINALESELVAQDLTTLVIEAIKKD